jgi:hypothetical protein
LGGRDPLPAYGTLSNLVQRVLRLAKDIEDEQISSSVWKIRYPYHCDSCLCGKAAAIDEVQREANWLMRLGEVNFALAWDVRFG